MATSFEELLDLSEFDGTSQIAEFIHKEDEGINTYRSTWSYVSYSYSRAFDELARKAFDDAARGANLGNALFFLARHSIELELKNIIVEYAETDDIPPQLTGHDLVTLWE
jgi:hypothetical protein